MQAARVGIWRCRSEVSKQWVSGGAEGKQWVSGGAEGKQWVSGGAEGKQWVSGGAEGKQWVFGGAVDVWRCRRQAVGVWGCRRQADCIWRHAKSIVMILSRPFLVPFLVPAFLLSQVPGTAAADIAAQCVWFWAWSNYRSISFFGRKHCISCTPVLGEEEIRL